MRARPRGRGPRSPDDASSDSRAKTFESELRVARETGKDVAAVVSALRGGARDALLGQVRSVLTAKPEIYDMGVSWQPGVFATDAAHVGEPTAGPRGELLARFTRPGGPGGRLEPGRLVVDGRASSPTKESMFVGNVGGMTLTAFLNPVLHDGEAVGLVGTDVPLTHLQEATQKIDVAAPTRSASSPRSPRAQPPRSRASSPRSSRSVPA